MPCINILNNRGGRQAWSFYFWPNYRYPLSIPNTLFKMSLCKAPGAGEIKSPKWCSLLFQRQSRPRMKGGADQPCRIASVFILTVQEAVLSHNEGRCKSAEKSNFCDAPCCPRDSLVPYKSEENQFHSVLAWQGRVPRCIKLMNSPFLVGNTWNNIDVIYTNSDNFQSTLIFKNCVEGFDVLGLLARTLPSLKYDWETQCSWRKTVLPTAL